MIENKPINAAKIRFFGKPINPYYDSSEYLKDFYSTDKLQEQLCQTNAEVNHQRQLSGKP